MPLGVEARPHARQRRFGWHRQSGGPVPPHPSPLPRGEGATPAALRSCRCARCARVWLGLPILWGEGWGEGELISRRFHGARSSEHHTLQTRFPFLAALEFILPFGLRISDFLRVSDFGFRICQSDWLFRQRLVVRNNRPLADLVGDFHAPHAVVFGDDRVLQALL